MRKGLQGVWNLTKLLTGAAGGANLSSRDDRIGRQETVDDALGGNADDVLPSTSFVGLVVTLRPHMGGPRFKSRIWPNCDKVNFNPSEINVANSPRTK